LVIGADGVRSRIAQAVGAPVVDARPPGGATHYAYVADLDGEGFEFHAGTDAFAGVFRTHGDEANVWLCAPAGDTTAIRGAGRTDGFLAHLRRAVPSLARRVERARLTSPVRGASGLPNHVRLGAGRGWALVGDAAYHRDPITAHGMTDAFRDAELLARWFGPALGDERAERTAAAGYDRERRCALEPVFDLTCRLAAHPPAEEFAALQRQLGNLLDDEAAWMASWPRPSRTTVDA
jgi:2-polyprenyl-6-methoxyphenol hydroxylase-like FAD-dependent oxidoreductase